MSTATITASWPTEAREALIAAVARCLPAWCAGQSETYAPIVADRIIREAEGSPVLIWAVDRVTCVDPIRGKVRPQDLEAGAAVKVYTVESVYRMLR